MILTTDFNKAASQFYQHMTLLRASKPAESFLEMHAYPWSSWNSCYNFAINKPSIYHIHTGDIARKKKPSIWCESGKFAALTQENAISDGLRFLGNDFSLVADDETPAALFLLDKKDSSFPWANDYHWFALRNLNGNMVWAHKPGSKKPEVCIDNDIFSIAKGYKYSTFGGYFAVPNAGFEETHDSHLSDFIGRFFKLDAG